MELVQVYLEVEFMHTKNNIIFNQKNYINIMLSGFGMLNYILSSTPMKKDTKLQINIDKELVKNNQYYRLVRS